MRDYASLYSALLKDLGYQSAPSGHIFSDMDARTCASVTLANSFYKKLCPGGNTKQADANALKKFIAINNRIADIPPDFVADNEAESCFYDYYKNNLRVALEPRYGRREFDLEYIREHMDVGPGAAQKADSSHMVTKLFESSISYANEALIPVYRAALAETGLWADAEMQRFQKYGFVKVRGGKIFFAAKDAEISRTCCTEASLEMLIQKAVGAYLEESLELSFGISLKTQPDFNRDMARIGSLDGSIGTIDLVSASDSVGLRLCQRDLPDGRLKAYLMMSRSRFAVLPDGEEVELSMVSTMGNGFTFPLQTLIFASAIRAVYQLMGYPCHDPRTQFGAFGDDLCVRKEAYDFTIKMLTKLGFEVNVGKSFNSGPFRESCGHDYANGVNIRGVYVRSLETPQEVVSCFNRLTRWSAYHGIPLTNVLRLLLTWTRDIRVPPSEADDAGIKVPFKLTTPKLDNAYWFKYRYFKRRVKKVEVREMESATPPDNEFGVGAGFLSGHLRRRDYVLTNLEDSPWKHDWAVRVSIRDKRGARARYQISTRSIPFWDFVRPNPKDSDEETQNGKPSEWSIPLTRDSQHAWESVLVALLAS